MTELRTLNITTGQEKIINSAFACSIGDLIALSENKIAVAKSYLVHILDIDADKVLRTLVVHDSDIVQIVKLSDNHLLSADTDGLICLSDLSCADEINYHTWGGSNSPITCAIKISVVML